MRKSAKVCQGDVCAGSVIQIRSTFTVETSVEAVHTSAACSCKEPEQCHRTTVEWHSVYTEILAIWIDQILYQSVSYYFRSNDSMHYRIMNVSYCQSNNGSLLSLSCFIEC